MKVEREPTSLDARRRLDEILAPHGLVAREGPAGVLVVVVGGEPEPGATIVRGEVFGLGSDVAGLTGARVRTADAALEASVGADGTFSFEGLAPGRHTLEASADGYLTQRAEVSVEPGTPRRVAFHLHPQPYLEEEIVVRPSRLTLLHERQDSSFALSREEIDRLPQLGGDLFRAVSLLPGTSANDVTAQFSIHGGRRDEVKVLLDGQELYEAYHLKDYDNALSIVSARSLSAASLSTGSYGAVHGDRMSGVLDLRTADAAAGRRHVVGVSVLDVHASAAGALGESGGWMVSGRRGSIALAGRFLGDEDPTFWDLLGKVEADTGAGRFAARTLHATDELEFDKVEGDGFERLENGYRSNYTWLTHQATPGASLAIDTTGSWSRIYRDRGGAGSEEEGSFVLSDHRNLEVFGAQQSWSLDLGARHLPAWGWELRRYDAGFDYAKDLDPELEILAPFSPPRLTEHAFDDTLRGDHAAAWASDRVTLFDRLTAEVGLRWDRHLVTADTLLSPRVNLAWRVDDRSVVRSSWGRFYQSQRPYELQVEDGEPALFRAERSEHAVLGYEAILAHQRVGIDAIRVELFSRVVDRPRPRYENLLEPLNFLPEIEPDRVRITPERGLAQGVEVLVRGRHGDRLEGWLAYSYSRSRDRIEGDYVARSLDQPHTLAWGLDYRLLRHWTLNLAWRFRTGWPTTPVEARLIVDPEEPEEGPELQAVFGALNSERLATYHRLDLRASRRWSLQRGTLALFIDVQNVYNRANLAGFDVELDEESGVIRAEEEKWPGTFPSVGVAWEF
jgi:outer membrane receptor protein involved in Fe transport